MCTPPFALLLLAACAAAQLPPPPALAPHPRLLLTPSRLAEINAAASAPGSDAASFLAMLKEHADWALAQPPVPRGQAGASGVLMQVRYSLDLLLSTAAYAALTGAVRAGEPHFDRALAEALNLATSWSDWNTKDHALDTGEALLATGLAYDWLAPGLSAGQRATLAAGIVERGFVPYKSFIGTTTFWWMNNTINWKLV